MVMKIKNSYCDESQKTQIMMKLNHQILKKLNNPDCDKNSTIQIMIKLNTSKCDTTQKLK